MKHTVIVGCALVLSACSGKSAFEFGQNHARVECVKNATTQWELEDCKKYEQASYEDYQEMKREAQKDKR